MSFAIHKNTVVVFDLDDTLYKEIDYLKSAYREISDVLKQEVERELFDEMMKLFYSGQEVFGNIIKKYGIKTKSKDELLSIYRTHSPHIQLEEFAAEKLDELKQKNITIGLITDGRSITQRNKLRSLGIENYFREIVISGEYGTCKPHPRNYMYIQEKLPKQHYVYIGDNVQKDFIAPNTLGWETVCLLDNGSNIHPQSLDNLKDEVKRPRVFIENFEELQINDC